jgi:hypothetical protein
MARNSCPYCDKEISHVEQLRAYKSLGPLIGIVRPFACPHCSKMVTWPKWAMRCVLWGCYLGLAGMALHVLEFRYYYIVRHMFWLLSILIFFGLLGLRLKKAA